jgi:hypothetical protein
LAGLVVWAVRRPTALLQVGLVLTVAVPILLVWTYVRTATVVRANTGDGVPGDGGAAMAAARTRTGGGWSA